jgi:hypothetical protein
MSYQHAGSAEGGKGGDCATKLTTVFKRKREVKGGTGCLGFMFVHLVLVSTSYQAEYDIAQPYSGSATLLWPFEYSHPPVLTSARVRIHPLSRGGHEQWLRGEQFIGPS